MKLSFWEIAVVVIVALVVIGPDKLPAYMKSLGKGFVQLRKATAEMSKDLKEEVLDPLNEASKPLKDAIEPVQETANMINDSMKSVNETIHDIEHPVQAAKKRAAEEKKVVEDESWVCPKCGNKATGKFCNECGQPKEEVKENLEEQVEGETK